LNQSEGRILFVQGFIKKVRAFGQNHRPSITHKLDAYNHVKDWVVTELASDPKPPATNSRINEIQQFIEGIWTMENDSKMPHQSFIYDVHIGTSPSGEKDMVIVDLDLGGTLTMPNGTKITAIKWVIQLQGSKDYKILSVAMYVHGVSAPIWGRFFYRKYKK